MGQSVMLRPDLGSTFRRSARDENGKVIETLEFQPKIPVELTDEQCKVVAPDLGAALVLVDVSKDGGRDLVKPDWETTNQVVVDVAREMQKKGESLRPHQVQALAESPEETPKRQSRKSPAKKRTEEMQAEQKAKNESRSVTTEDL